jgi:hypothetical protein
MMLESLEGVEEVRPKKSGWVENEARDLNCHQTIVGPSNFFELAYHR